MSAYLLIKATIFDPEKFSRYTQIVPELVKQYGGQYVVMDSAPELFEGEKDCQTVVISKWPDKASAKAFWASEAYQKAIPLREGTGEFYVSLVQGLD